MLQSNHTRMHRGVRRDIGKLNRLKRACAAFLMCAASAIALPAQTFTVVHSFDGTDGSGPQGALLQATDGNLYGATTYGGSSGACPGGCGTIFKITPSGGTPPILYSFCSQTGCTDGQYPDAGLVQATDGNFYGTTELGGVNGNYGTIFKITPTGGFTTLYSFCSQIGCADGFFPLAGLIQAADGNFYGTTYGGGANGYGTVFKITPSGALTTLYSFCSQSGCTDGATLYAGLIQAADGNFYGTTYSGGETSSMGRSSRSHRAAR